ncbi:hypothetical protein F2P56_013679 [Juglans regia]|uniref:START domain-containing protein n=1 Tax=Juglans regia TaxID=51240 RepID=A0A833XRC3_JUGRE|nr:hypothetical protein F2P56_013679 [Juglans regia]
METTSLGKSGSERSEKDGSSGSSSGAASEERGSFEYFGCVYHLGVNSIGREYCHLRFLFIRGKYVEMYKRDPHESPGIQPIRKGVVGPTLMVEEIGRRTVNRGDVYVLRFYNRLDETKKGEIACATAGETRKWMDAFDHAKQQAEYELSRRGSARNKLNMETEKGPETLLRQSSDLGSSVRPDRYSERDSGDVVEAHEWKCVRTINGVRIFEDVADSKSGNGVLVKSVGVVDATADTVFEVILNVERHHRYEWDMLTGDLELIDSYDGHYDVVYGIFDPKYLTCTWNHAFCLAILQFPTVHKKKPPRSGYRRTKISPSTWEVRSLNTPMDSNASRCLVTQMLEIHSSHWLGWKKNHFSKFEKSVPYAILCQVAGIKEYIEANPAFKHESATTVVHSKMCDISMSIGEYDEYEDAEMQDEFYDAIADDSSSSEDEESSNGEHEKKEMKVKLKNVSWAITSLALHRTSAPDANKELNPTVTPIIINPLQFQGSLHRGKDDTDANCWTSPSGMGFMIRGKTYLKDNSKVMGGDPLLKLIAVDWFKVDERIDNIALHPKCLVQSEVGKKIPFILVINLQVPAKPNYSLVLYYAADRPIKKRSLLARFVDGNDMFRDARFKLIPSIVEGYWMVKRAVGTKACLLGKAVTCKYFRQDNFLEIDVDIGSSSVARSVIGLVLGYVTSIVVDLAILIEAKEEAELPEYILGTVRLNKLRPDSAVHLEA